MSALNKQVSGICPKSGQTQVVEITFKEIRSLGAAPYYAPSNYHCEYAMEHRCDMGVDCPLVKVAEREINL